MNESDNARGRDWPLQSVQVPVTMLRNPRLSPADKGLHCMLLLALADQDQPIPDLGDPKILASMDNLAREGYLDYDGPRLTVHLAAPGGER